MWDSEWASCGGSLSKGVPNEPEMHILTICESWSHMVTIVASLVTHKDSLMIWVFIFGNSEASPKNLGEGGEVCKNKPNDQRSLKQIWC